MERENLLITNKQYKLMQRLEQEQEKIDDNMSRDVVKKLVFFLQDHLTTKFKFENNTVFNEFINQKLINKIIEEHKQNPEKFNDPLKPYWMFNLPCLNYHSLSFDEYKQINITENQLKLLKKLENKTGKEVFIHQENFVCYPLPLNSVLKYKKMIKNIAKFVEKTNLSPLESYLLIYEICSQNYFNFPEGVSKKINGFLHDNIKNLKHSHPKLYSLISNSNKKTLQLLNNYFQDEYIAKPSSICSVVESGNIICAGYSYIMKEIIDYLNIPELQCAICENLLSDKVETSPHQNNLIKIYDDKYNVDGVYFSDLSQDVKEFNPNKTLNEKELKSQSSLQHSLLSKSTLKKINEDYIIFATTSNLNKNPFIINPEKVHDFNEKFFESEFFYTINSPELAFVSQNSIKACVMKRALRAMYEKVDFDFDKIDNISELIYHKLNNETYFYGFKHRRNKNTYNSNKSKRSNDQNIFLDDFDELMQEKNIENFNKWISNKPPYKIK